MAPVRGYADGSFDLIHSGHYNAIRQASLLCDTLIVGVNCGAGIAEVKGPVTWTDAERCSLIESCKFATNIEQKTPYDCSEVVLDKFNCQFYLHGDDAAPNN